MVVVRAPFRISLFGGGTDYPTWVNAHGGQVLSGTIDKYCTITARALPPFFASHRHRIVWSLVEEIAEIRDIAHPAVRAVMEFLKWDPAVGVEVHHQGDLPARAGMGSSSAFTVALLHALRTLKGLAYSAADQLATDAIHIEQKILKENVGVQDQCAAAFGGFNRYEFDGNGVRTSRAVVSHATIRELESRLSLWYLGPRAPGVTGSDVALKYDPKSTHLRVLSSMVSEAIALLHAENFDAVGQLLHEGWLLKQEIGGGDPRAVDAYALGRSHGALGGKLLGAGGGGFMLFYGLDKGAELPFLRVPFKFTHEGSRVVYCGETL